LAIGNVLISGHAAGFEADVLELADEGLDGDSVLEGDGDQCGDGVHQSPNRRAFLGHGDEDFAGGSVLVEADGDISLVAGDVELMRDRVTGIGEAAAQGSLDDPFDDALDDAGVFGGGFEVVGRHGLQTRAA
jgi:hypothetical protein